MISPKLNSIIVTLIDLTVAAVLLVVPLFFAFIIKTNNVFELNKLVIFKILVLAIILLTLIKFIIDRESRSQISYYKKLFYSKSRLFVFCILALSFLVSAIIGTDHEASILGSYDRQQGIVTFGYLFLYFGCLLLNIRNQKQLFQLFFIASVGAFFVGLYAIIQAMGLDPIGWSESTALRSISTLGQPNNLGSYLLATIPLTAFLLYSVKRYVLRIFLFISFLVQLSAFYFSFSTSSWIAFFVGVFVSLLFYFIWKHDKKQSEKTKEKNKRMYWKFALIPIFLLFIILALGRSDGLMFKFNNLVNLQTGSTAVRMQFWKASIEAIKERPWLGYGLETQSDVLVRYYDPNWALFSRVNVQPSRAHNIVLDILLTRGVLGLVASMAFLLLIYYSLVRNLKKNRSIPLTLVLFFYFSAYFTYLFFNFHHITSLVFFTFSLAVLVLISSNDFVLKTVQPNKQVDLPKTTLEKKFAIYISILLASGLMFIMADRQIKILVNDHYLHELKVARENKNYFFALDLYDFFQRNRIPNSYYERQFGIIISEWAYKFYSQFYDMGMEKVRIILPKIDKDSFADIYSRAKLCTALAREDSGYYDCAIKNFDKLVTISPNLPIINREYAQMLVAMGGAEKALKFYNLSLNNIPDTKNVVMNMEHQEYANSEIKLNYTGIISAYEKLGNEKKVNEYQELYDDLLGM